MNEATWRRLLSLMRDDVVVPIVGCHLLIDSNTQSSLQAQVAKQLLALYDVKVDAQELPPFRELNEAVTRLLMLGNQGPKLQDLYADVHTVITEAISGQNSPIPLPLRQLAEITDFRLFVTLTPDNLLARALRQSYAVNEVIHSPALPSTDESDLPTDWLKHKGEAYILYLFGKSRPAPVFAIHDEDVLEYAHNIIARDHYVPSKFLNELRQRSLLLIGCNFPEWLSRFFLRATSESRLSQLSRREWLIEQPQNNESFIYFLHSYSKDTEVLSDIPPVEFVAELHRRWMSENGGEKSEKRAAVAATEAIPRGTMFFISYSRATDLPRAEALYKAIIALGVADSEVWFDRSTIEPGQDFRQSILEGISACRYFLPLLSDGAMQREEAFVFDEWQEANARNNRMNRDFILPVIVDIDYHPERYKAKAINIGGWARLDYCHAPAGEPDGRMVSKLTELVREARRGKTSDDG